MTAARELRGSKAWSGTSRSPLAALPHERDESPDGTAKPTPSMRVAATDAASGAVDTDCRGATPARECELPALLKPPPLDAQRKRDGAE